MNYFYVKKGNGKLIAFHKIFSVKIIDKYELIIINDKDL